MYVQRFSVVPNIILIDDRIPINIMKLREEAEYIARRKIPSENFVSGISRGISPIQILQFPSSNIGRFFGKAINTEKNTRFLIFVKDNKMADEMERLLQGMKYKIYVGETNESQILNNIEKDVLF